MELSHAAPRMLIVEDDADVGAGLEEYFELKGFDVARVADGETGLQRLTMLPKYDVVLLDVMLPEKNGFDVLREARRAGVDCPVIMLTVKARDDDKLRAFDLGADDYVTKPFNAEELTARVNAVLRRSKSPSERSMEQYTFGDVVVNFSENTVFRGDDEVPFTALEFDILEYFIRHRGRTVSRKQLLRDVWEISGEITTRTIDRHVASLRKKVEPDSDDPSYIETVYGIGYKFNA
ncbi:MAG: response regulator transcription factor [Rhodothermales bacterium]